MLSQGKTPVEVIAAAAPHARETAPAGRQGRWLFLATLAASGIGHALILLAFNQGTRTLPEVSQTEAVDVVIIDEAPVPPYVMARADLQSIGPVINPLPPATDGRRPAAAVPPVTPLSPVRPQVVTSVAPEPGLPTSELPPPTGLQPVAPAPALAQQSDIVMAEREDIDSPLEPLSAAGPKVAAAVAPEAGPPAPELPPPARLQPVAPPSTLPAASAIAMAVPAEEPAPTPFSAVRPEVTTPVAPAAGPPAPSLPPPARIQPVAPTPVLPAESAIVMAEPAHAAPAPGPYSPVGPQLVMPVASAAGPPAPGLPPPARSQPVAPAAVLPAALDIGMAALANDAVPSPKPPRPARPLAIRPVPAEPGAAATSLTAIHPGPPPPVPPPPDAVAGVPSNLAPVSQAGFAKSTPVPTEAVTPRLAPVAASSATVIAPSQPGADRDHGGRVVTAVAGGPSSIAKRIVAPTTGGAPPSIPHDVTAVAAVRPADPVAPAAAIRPAGAAVAALAPIAPTGQMAATADFTTLLGEQIAELSCASITHAFDRNEGKYILAGFTSSEAEFVRFIADLPEMEILDTTGVMILPEPFCSVLRVVHQSGAQLSPMQRETATAATGAPKFRGGEIFSMGMRTPEFDGFVYVDYFTQSGDVAHLVSETTHSGSNFFPRNEWVQIGGPDGIGRRGVIAPPFGLDWVLGLASTHPLELVGRPDAEPIDDYLSALSRALLELKQRYPDATAEYVHLFVRTEPPSFAEQVPDDE